MAEETNLPRIEAPIYVDRDDEYLVQFAEKSLEKMRERLDHNHQEAYGLTDVEKSVDEVLANHNVRSINIRARPLENPKVTLWLKDCPIWANDAWTETFNPWDFNKFNGRVTVTFDVRPF